MDGDEAGGIDEVLVELKGQLETSVTSLASKLSKLRTGRANVAILDGVRVSYYGSMTPLAECAQLAVADARMLTVKPWDRGLISEIERSLLGSNLGLTPQNDGDLIRIPIPALTQERRKDLCKQVRQKGEEAKIAVRSHRRDANEMLKEYEKAKEISQDDLRRGLEQIQEATNAVSAKLDDVLAKKEQEILAV